MSISQRDPGQSGADGRSEGGRRPGTGAGRPGAEGCPTDSGAGPRPTALACAPARALLGLQLAGAMLAGLVSWRLGAGVPLAVVIGAATPVLVHGAALAVGFAGSWAAAGRPRPIGPWLRTFVREWPRSMRMTYLMLAWCEGFALPPAAGAPPTGAAPILLLHGFSCNRGVWSLAARWFAARGRRVEALSIWPAYGSIDGAVASVEAAIARLRAELPRLPDGQPAPVHIVAHSMGGLVARAYLRRHGWHGIGAVVTLGTPHRGTWQSWLGLGEASRQMRPDSAWLRQLAQDEPRPPPGRMLVVASRQDNIVSRPATQTVPGAKPILVDGLGHMAFVLEPRIVGLVLRFIAGVERRMARPVEKDAADSVFCIQSSTDGLY